MLDLLVSRGPFVPMELLHTELLHTEQRVRSKQGRAENDLHLNGLMMSKLLVDCGNCGPDFNSIRRMVSSHFKASVVQTHGLQDTLEILRDRKVDLVTINRKLDRDYSDGIEILKQIKADPELSSVPVMLVSNYQEHQQAAIDAGGVPGFGKLAIEDTETRELLEPYLGA